MRKLLSGSAVAGMATVLAARTATFMARIHGYGAIQRYVHKARANVAQRSRNATARRGGAKLHSNRLHISRRVRRKHRRATA